MVSSILEPINLPEELSRLSHLIEEAPEYLGSGSKNLEDVALNATKFLFDLSLKTERSSQPYISELLSSLSPSQAPQTRSQARTNARQNLSPSPIPQTVLTITPLEALFIDGMDEDQIWAQLDLRAKNVCEMLELALEGEVSEEGGGKVGSALDSALRDLDQEDDMDVDEVEEDEDEEDEDEEDDVDNSYQDEVDDKDEDGRPYSDLGDDADLGEHVAELNDSSEDEDEEAMDDNDEPSLPHAIRRNLSTNLRKPKASIRTALDDGFFNLAQFNAETEQAEARTVSKGGLGDSEESDDDISVDMFAPVDDMPNFDEEDLENDPRESLYKDFFEPPPRSASSKAARKPMPRDLPKKSPGQVRFHEEVRIKKIKAIGKNLPLSTMYDDDDDEADDEDSSRADVELGEADLEDDSDQDIEGTPFGFSENEEFEEEDNDENDPLERETIERLKDDLFAEDNEPEPDLSTHQKRMAELREQIASLEAENVGKKDWVLMGEADSRSRPKNSLLEEDVEFERVMKAVPVTTEESVQGLEERIKARILEGRFDDVIRLRPMDDKPFLPSKFFELKDTKSTKSLAEIYADEYTATQEGGVAGDDRDGKLKKEQNEIEQTWESICAKLDALCNAHFVPKQPKATISTIANVSTATLESALPTTKSTSTLLAPEEIFKPSSSALRSRSELTPAEKQALRTKERKIKKKTRDTLENSVDKYGKMKGIGRMKKQKQAALESVVKSGRGVTVVGKKSKEVLMKKRPLRT